MAAVAMLAGCRSWGTNKTPTPPLGTQSDCIWRKQEVAAAASDFVVYQHEFELDGTHLNMAGEDHLKSIAARLHCGAPMPVVVERSMTSINPDSKYKYPVNPNPELDMNRRENVVKSLVALGIANADQCVLVAPAMAEGYTDTEATQAYYEGMTDARGDSGRGSGGHGGFGSSMSVP
jgi:hypothetical protein